MSQHKNDSIKRPKPQDTQLGRKMSKNSAESLGLRRDCCLCYVVSVFENTPKNLVFQGRAQLEHSSHIVKVAVEAT